MKSFTTGRTHRVIYSGTPDLPPIQYRKCEVFKGKIVEVIEEVDDTAYAIRKQSESDANCHIVTQEGTK